MPELPEVQTTVNGLNYYTRNLKITNIWSDYASFYYKNKENIKDQEYFKLFKKNILNCQIKNTKRLGKNILIFLNKNLIIIIHMKMTGSLIYGNFPFQTNQQQQNLQSKHIRLTFKLNNGYYLALSDVRKFAKILFLSKSNLKNYFEKIGPDPLKINSKQFIALYQNKKYENKKIKEILLNQEIISGIGNIYSDEILYASHIHPERILRKIKKAELLTIYNNTKKILKKSIILGGDSTKDYYKINGQKGEFQKHHKVYLRKGLPCLNKKCQNTIKSVKIAGRTSHFCDKEQK